jgi:superfamily II DNA/RNA helicase
LKVEGFRVGVLHGGMAQSAREESLGQLAAGVNDVLVATELAARGLDLEHITLVINFDPPVDEKDYPHRVGRMARVDRTGTGITLVTPEKRAELGEIGQGPRAAEGARGRRTADGRASKRTTPFRQPVASAPAAMTERSDVRSGDSRHAPPRPPCPVCGSLRIQPFTHAGPVARVNMKCTSCGHLFKRPSA